MSKVSKKKFYELAELYQVPVDDEQLRENISKVVINDFINALKDEFNKPKNKWIPWNGGECPVDCDTMVTVKFRDGDIFKHKSANYWDWSHYGAAVDIIAYKIVKD